MKLWIDDVRPAPKGYCWIKSVSTAIEYIEKMQLPCNIRVWGELEIIDLDHDAGEYSQYGGDYIKILDYMEENNINNIPIRIHSANPVGVANMRRIIERNSWEEVK